jgi:hypothetical protein
MTMMPDPSKDAPYSPLPPQENGFLKFVQQPRVLLILLAAWSLLGFLTQLLVNSALFVEKHGEGDVNLDGALGGLALGWQGLPLAILFLYCARDPDRYRAVFWLALIASCASVASGLYHWLVTDLYSIESVLVPVGVSAGLAVLAFLQLFAGKDIPAEQVRS